MNNIIDNFDYFVIAVYFLIFIYLVLTKKKTSFYRFLIATAQAFIWMLIGKNEYGYNRDFLIVRGMNLLPLFVWALGLFASYSLCQLIWKKQVFWQRLLFFLVVYWSMLIFTETIAYHLLNIRNIAASAYKGLPICDCVHAAPWMQAVYFAMGPIHFIILQILSLS